jgi:dipeptidyl aminopeptidase/acylaminoacyl peptidase
LILASFALLLLLPAPAPAPTPRHAFTVDDMWAVKRVAAPALSPDGRRVAYTVTTWDAAENKSNADLWVVDVRGGEPRRLTTHKSSDSTPAWSPDGTRLAFVSKREGDTEAQLYVLRVDGGEPERITEMPMGAGDPKWTPDGRSIVFSSHVVAGAESPAETKKALAAREANKVKAYVSESRLFRYWDRWLTQDEYPHLFVVDVARREVKDLLPGSRRLFDLQSGSASFDISPDGTQVVFHALSAEPPYRELAWDLFLVPTTGGEVRNLTGDNPGPDLSPRWSPDGREIAYSRGTRPDDWPEQAKLAVLELASGRSRVLTADTDLQMEPAAWTRDGRALLVHAEARARTNLYRVPSRGGVLELLRRGGSTSGALAAPDGTIVFLEQTMTSPSELYALDPKASAPRALTAVNRDLAATWDLGPIEDTTFLGADGDEVQMYVVHPPGFDRAKKYPLVHVIHGGPVGTSADNFHARWNPLAFAAPGYVVALVNFHGSSSFGQRFTESILGAHPDKPFTDIMKATDALVARGYVDPERIGAAGGSYGGFLVNWIAGHTDRFDALVTHAGVYNLLGQFGSDDTYGRHHSYGGYPFRNLENVEKWSPNRYAAGFVTPMLIVHGERDYRVPYTQGLELYGTLQAKGVPARLVVYPDENHWVLKGQNARHWYGEVLGWFARWLR